jgi:hypothetical protein
MSESMRTKSMRSDTPATAPALRLRRKCACGQHSAGGGECEECKKKREESLRRSALDTAPLSGVPPIVHQALGAPGRPLDPATRAFMEPRFGRDFSGVRVHSDPLAAESARAVQAHAYTVGSDIVLGEERGGGSERRLLAHELAHVVQQSQGSGTARSESAEEAEADRAADHVMAGRAGAPELVPGTPTLRRNGLTPPEVQNQVRKAAMICDLSQICTLHWQYPAIVDLQRVRAIWAQCRGEKSLFLINNPCLMPGPLGFGPGSQTQPAPGPLVPLKPGGPGTTPQTAGGSSPLSGLSDKLNVSLKLGKFSFDLAIPKTATALLKIPLDVAKARHLEISLEAATEKTFSFKIAVDATEKLRIQAGTKIDADKKTGSASLSMTFGSKVCEVKNKEKLRTDIQAAGDELVKALNELQKPTPPKPGEDPKTEMDRLKDIAEKIGKLYEAADAAKDECKKVPRFSLGLGSEWDLEGPKPNQPPKPITPFNFSLKWYF